MRRVLYVPMDRLLDAMDTTNPAQRFALDLETGEVEPLLEGEPDARWALVPRPAPDGAAERQARREALLIEALAWLRGLGVEPQYELGPAAAAAPAEAPGPTLLDLALLGAPPDAPPVEDGQVVRRLQTRSPEQARRAFRGLAHALAALHGLPAPGDIADGHPYVAGRARLTIDGTRVDLWVGVPPEVRRAFVARVP